MPVSRVEELFLAWILFALAALLGVAGWAQEIWQIWVAGIAMFIGGCAVWSQAPKV